MLLDRNGFSCVPRVITPKCLLRHLTRWRWKWFHVKRLALLAEHYRCSRQVKMKVRGKSCQLASDVWASVFKSTSSSCSWQQNRFQFGNVSFHDHVTYYGCLGVVTIHRGKSGRVCTFLGLEWGIQSRDKGAVFSQGRPVHGNQYRRSQRHVKGVIKALNKPRTLVPERRKAQTSWDRRPFAFRHRHTHGRISSQEYQVPDRDRRRIE